MSKIYNIKGVKLACASSNTRYGKRDDSLVITLDEKSTISGKFTSNSFKAAPIKIAQKNLTSLLPGKKALLIKRYASRRLYNTETSDYVTLEDIARFIHDGRDVQILDLKSCLLYTSDAADE